MDHAKISICVQTIAHCIHCGMWAILYVLKPYNDSFRLISDDAFFNRNWAGARGGRWVGPELLADWGYRLLDRRG